MIFDRKLYPVTYLRNLTAVQKSKLTGDGIALIRGVAGAYPTELAKKTGLPISVITRIAYEAKALVLGGTDEPTC
jgi:hypothetical protein